MDKEAVLAIGAFWIYKIGGFATFAYLTAMDASDFNAWNWILIIPINLFLGAIWLLYWPLLHWMS